VETSEKKAKLFLSGHSQAVRLPKEFRFYGTEVRIHREGRRVVLEPIDDTWAWFEEMDKLGGFDDDAVKAIQKKVAQQKRPALDKLFR
jgi:antitoxin VapB